VQCEFLKRWEVCSRICVICINNKCQQLLNISNSKALKIAYLFNNNASALGDLPRPPTGAPLLDLAAGADTGGRGPHPLEAHVPNLPLQKSVSLFKAAKRNFNKAIVDSILRQRCALPSPFPAAMGKKTPSQRQAMRPIVNMSEDRATEHRQHAQKGW